MTTQVHEEIASTASEMLEILNISQAKWTPSTEWKCPWVFRGQMNSEWNLCPSAWRNADDDLSLHIKAIKLRYAESMRDHIYSAVQNASRKQELNLEWVTEAYVQARAEFKLIHEFIELSDSLGFQVPDASKYTNLSHHDYIPDIGNVPLAHLIPGPNSASALAQHHGIPTRGLDWTKDPLVAAYFACEGIQESKAGMKISVWAIHPDKILEFGRAHQFNDDRTRFLSVNFPKGNNEYLKAQDGILIYPTYGCQHYINNGCWPDFEQFALRLQNYSNETLIRKITLSYDHVEELQRLLWIQNVSKAHLMPTFDNVTNALKGKWKWNISI